MRTYHIKRFTDDGEWQILHTFEAVDDTDAKRIANEWAAAQ